MENIVAAAVVFAATLGALAATRRAQNPKQESRPNRSQWFISAGVTVLPAFLILLSRIVVLLNGPT